MKPNPTFLSSFVCILFAARLWAGPANDEFADRTILTGTNVTISGDNSGAGSETGEVTEGFFVLLLDSVWYEWTAPTDGVVHVSGSTEVLNFYMSIGVYRGTAVNALRLLAWAPNGGLPVHGGDTISIQVASIITPSGAAAATPGRLR
jgi:hypothetical protein